ncbi:MULTISPECIES: GntR family transcriptional regulator [unclassified Caballeronia]|uniref:GntR family transcriptional regulator n=1 Tax=unclassified Caballeronia TaxID=2646786 RepID=UPI002855F44D|nr:MULTISPECIES: GntR family transcriptional regulator [unclassified Caballeronia]MDR5813956.1 GntR family transcriptional regulator [Caballeronia sp. LZ033]MDR5823420.1 GntR family transcriptional regulator [Caballeronia sp. LZ043]MDR5878500.1 GntR family transcriptional regulator [Caballeronia sp. LZ032]
MAASTTQPETDPAANPPAPETRVHAAITSALLQGKLAPGAQLVERELAAAFGCTRGTIRKVLARLGAEGKLTLEVNRGAFVPSPTVADIRAAYRARQVVEAGIVASLCGALGTQAKRALRAHVKAEQRAVKAGSVEECVRLAGCFHVLLAELANAPEVQAFLSKLVAKTELYKALFDPSKVSNCASDEHEQLVDALEAGNLEAALATMRLHIDELESRVLAQAGTARGNDLATLFAGA